MDNKSSIRVCSFNCRSVKNSLVDVIRLCNGHDIVCLQEHWLLPNELNFLNSVHEDFYSIGASAVDITSDILIGRPYGGTAILYRKSLISDVTVVPCSDSRVTGLKINTDFGPLVLLSVYMPTEYNDDDSLEKYINVCSFIAATFIECDAANIMIIGDFNCQPGTRFYQVISQLMYEYNLVMSDINMLVNAFTYCSDAGNSTSWLDHVLVSHGLNSKIANISVLYDYICSDHRPLSVDLKCIYMSDPLVNDVVTELSNSKPVCSDWSRADVYILNSYLAELNTRLNMIVMPSCVSGCDRGCNMQGHMCAIDKYYDEVMECIKKSMQSAIPNKQSLQSEFNVPGWNDIVKEKYELSREAFLEWVVYGRPRFGPIYYRMARLKASFKLALRYCKQHSEQIKANACAAALDLGDSRKFWKQVSKLSNDRVTNQAHCVDGVTGDDNIAALWKEHFNNMYNSVVDIDSKVSFYRRIDSGNVKKLNDNISVSDVCDVVRKQKRGKATGLDGIAMEAYIFADSKLFIHLSLLFNLFLNHCHIPAALMQSVVVPLVKAKGGDLTDINNYRAIAVSNSISKILETVFMCKVESVAEADSYQFGFKSGHSTGLCTNTLKEVIQYYRERGSHVFTCFVDFTRAFDRVNYWKLFNKLLDDGVSVDIVALLAFWYSNQELCVRWKSNLSSTFCVNNGTRQGGILSPYLFSRYIRDLIWQIARCGVGCNIGGKYYNILAYADDIVLLAPSWDALQCLIRCLNVAAGEINMTCNVKKTVCMVFKPVVKKFIVAEEFPPFYIGDKKLEFVNEFRYLGHIINNKFSDDDDIKREIRNLFMRTNILLRRYNKCSIGVKLMIFRAYCVCFYDVGLWRIYSNTTFNKLRSCYNKCVKMFFGYSRRDSVTQMLAELHLSNFDNLFASYDVSFKSRWCSCQNDLIVHLVSLA